MNGAADEEMSKLSPENIFQYYQPCAVGIGEATSMLPGAYWITLAVTMLIVTLCVVLHYETLRLLTDYLPTPPRHHRRRIVILILCLLLLHIVEIWIFGAGYYFLLQRGSFGDLSSADLTMFDTIYFSASVYTTLGFGDIVPTGAIRFLTGTEALSGFMLITWSASYVFVEMLKTWKRGED